MNEGKNILCKENICSHFQPIVCLKTGRIFAYEALVRGIQPETNKIVLPDELFAVANEENRSEEFDILCQQSALEYFQKFSNTSKSLLFMNINTSLITSNKGAFVSLNSMTQKMGFSPNEIALELIESKAKDSNDLIAFVKHYRETGYLIVIDDFGCEHSNMERLVQIKPDIIKVDRSIISGIESDTYRQSILKSIHALSEMTGSLCLAEGVETEEEILTCYKLGVDLFQGYGIIRPAFDLYDLEKQSYERIHYLRSLIKKETLSLLKEKRRLTGDINSLADWLIRQISSCSISEMESILQEFMILNSEIECIYLLDNKGIQISNPILPPFMKKKKRSYIFAPTEKGTDNSFKSYFTCFEVFKIDRYLTDPYLSSASGNLCRTFAVKLDRDNDFIILCIDFIEEIIKTPITY